ncbi:hypothetical protein GYMLUDRAFT_631219 [Collybiopsis luxurians FD-317 M1]|nr:hypothetical protein GYMLUDRAFT_631219 [Collybiopsis luxurians FD-317 M1]
MVIVKAPRFEEVLLVLVFCFPFYLPFCLEYEQVGPRSQRNCRRSDRLAEICLGYLRPSPLSCGSCSHQRQGCYL